MGVGSNMSRQSNIYIFKCAVGIFYLWLFCSLFSKFFLPSSRPLSKSTVSVEMGDDRVEATTNIVVEVPPQFSPQLPILPIMSDIDLNIPDLDIPDLHIQDLDIMKLPRISLSGEWCNGFYNFLLTLRDHLLCLLEKLRQLICNCLLKCLILLEHLRRWIECNLTRSPPITCESTWLKSWEAQLLRYSRIGTKLSNMNTPWAQDALILLLRNILLSLLLVMAVKAFYLMLVWLLAEEPKKPHEPTEHIQPITQPMTVSVKIENK